MLKAVKKGQQLLPDFEKRNTILKDFNKLLDDEDAAWLAFNKNERTGDELFKQIEARRF